jgi:hypothetical protein
MLFSRRFVEILNVPRGSETPGAQVKMREIVERWAAKQVLEPEDARWLNGRAVAHRTTVKATVVPGRPETETEIEKHAQELDRIAAASFAEFLSEVTESRVSGAGRLGVRVCPACGNLFVQEDVGRDKLVCSARCKFRIRRKAQKDREKGAPRKRPSTKRGGKSGCGSSSGGTARAGGSTSGTPTAIGGDGRRGARSARPRPS